MSELTPAKFTDLELDYQGTTLPCPLSEGHHLIPVKTVCDIIDVKFQTQDSWLKDHPYFSQLYLLGGVVAADGKVRQMNCLPMFDLLSWLASISENQRKTGSPEKQYAFMAWLRTKMLDLYKSINVYREENRYEQELVQQKEEIELEISQNKQKEKELKEQLKKIDTAIEDIRINRFTGQTALPFD